MSEKIPSQPASSEAVEKRLDDQAVRESASRAERIAFLSSEVKRVFSGESLSELRAEIETSFDVPQFGDYHNEGMYMDTHLELILKNVRAIAEDKFTDEIQAQTRQTLKSVVANNEDTLTRYTFLHDLSKKDCLTVRYDDGSAKEFTWQAWQEQLAADSVNDPVSLRAYCKKNKVKGISYYQKGEKKGESKTHGSHAKKLLEPMGEKVGVSSAVLTAIDKHEVAYQFSKISAATYKDHLSSLTGEERDLSITASYIDTAASLRKDGKADLSNFVALVGSKDNYELLTQLQPLLEANGALDQKKVQKAMVDSMKLDRRIDLDLNALLAKLEQECQPTEYKMDVLEQQLNGLGDVITPDENGIIMEAVIKKDLSALGRLFGKRMAKINQALQASEKK